VDPEAITIKGIRQGLLVTLPQHLANEDWRAELGTLDERLGANPAFFRGGRVALNVGSRELDRADLQQARTLLTRHQVELWAVVGTSKETEAAAQKLGLVIDLGPTRPPAPETVPRDEAAGAPGKSAEPPLSEDLVVRRTLRSGQSLRHPGHVVVIGDVNSGAEVVAGGDIVVWGRVRGVVHAGALGNEAAIICALDLAPTQLRIAGYIARSPEDKRRKPVPEVASVHDGHIVAESWKGR
jgi:septum site-determining protein MinC